MSKIYDRLTGCLNSVREKTDFVPEVAIVLGSGLGDYAAEIEVEKYVDYSEIDNFPLSTVEGHKGRFVFGYVKGVPIVAMQGRVHYYEGYKMEDVVLPTRLMYMLGARKLILTNASGGVNREFNAGDLMLITDQIALNVPNPLIGENANELGERFPDMSEIYSHRLCDIIRKTAAGMNQPLKEGVYVQLTGPSYETPAEVKLLRTCGADAVGMSTACEAIAARQMGMEICGISCVTNPASDISDKPLSHAEVQEVAERVSKQFKALATEIIAVI